LILGIAIAVEKRHHSESKDTFYYLILTLQTNDISMLFYYEFNDGMLTVQNNFAHTIN